jgi:cytochrome b
MQMPIFEGMIRMPRKPVIDLPVRLFHWTLVISVALAWASAEWGYMDRHMAIGQFILALLVFRVFWGFAGSPTARFGTFLASPARVLRYLGGMLDRTKPMSAGYNPLGGWAIMAMLAALLFQTGTGLFATDDIFVDGPLAHLVSKPTQQWLAGLHEENFEIVVIGLIALHLAANLFYGIYKRQPLVKRMITGTQETAEPVPAPAPLWRAAILFALSCALVWATMNYVYLTR